MRCSFFCRVAVCLLALSVCLLSGKRLAAQEPAKEEPKQAEPAKQEPAIADEKQLIGAIFEQTKTAKSVEEFDGIINAITEARKQPLSQANADYLKSLIGWAYNRRGELRLDGLATVSDQQQASKLLAEALADFEESIKYDATHWRRILNRGVSYAQAGRLKEAEADMSTVVKMNPLYANAWFNRGEIYFQLGQYDKAIADYQQVLSLAPRDLGAVTGLGHAYFVQKDYNNAILWYDRAVQLQPNSAEALANRGDAYHRNGQWDRAGADYLAAVAIDENLGRVYQSGAWLWATCPIPEARNEDEALRAAKRAIELDGDGNYQYLDTLAAAYARAGNFEQARATIAQAIVKAPAAERDVLEMRQKLYAAGKPYEQFMFQPK